MYAVRKSFQSDVEAIAARDARFASLLLPKEQIASIFYS